MPSKPTLQGPRLPYVVRKLDGVVTVTKHRFNRRDGKIETYEEEEDAGYIAFFPRGHYLRIRNKDDLIKYRLDKKPKPIGPDGSALHPSQKPEVAYENLEAAVVDYVRAISGPISIPGFKGEIPLPKRVAEESYV